VKTVSRPYAAALLDYGTLRDDIVVLSGDLTASCEADLFRDAHPERFLNCGMAEQNMMGIAGGLARGGLLPIVHTFGVFATRRPLDQVEMAIALPRARVRIMGFLPGLTTPGGPTHQSIDDVSIMRALPGMTVLDCGDATEIAEVLEAVDGVDGPVYCRMMRGDVPLLHEPGHDLTRPRMLRRGGDLVLLSCSIATMEATRAAEALAGAGIGVTHAHVAQLAPLELTELDEAIAGSRGVITLENHLVTGGLGSAVAEHLAGLGAGVSLVRLGVPSTYAVGGSQAYLFERFGISANAVLDAAEHLLETEVGVRFAGEELVGAGDLARQEAL
jgi:transketolase